MGRLRGAPLAPRLHRKHVLTRERRVIFRDPIGGFGGSQLEV